MKPTYYRPYSIVLTMPIRLQNASSYQKNQERSWRLTEPNEKTFLVGILLRESSEDFVVLVAAMNLCPPVSSSICILSFKQSEFKKCQQIDFILFQGDFLRSDPEHQDHANVVPVVHPMVGATCTELELGGALTFVTMYLVDHFCNLPRACIH
jgi:hypothetical protein